MRNAELALFFTSRLVTWTMRFLLNEKDWKGREFIRSTPKPNKKLHLQFLVQFTTVPVHLSEIQRPEIGIKAKREDQIENYGDGNRKKGKQKERKNTSRKLIHRQWKRSEYFDWISVSFLSMRNINDLKWKLIRIIVDSWSRLRIFICMGLFESFSMG